MFFLFATKQGSSAVFQIVLTITKSIIYGDSFCGLLFRFSILLVKINPRKMRTEVLIRKNLFMQIILEPLFAKLNPRKNLFTKVNQEIWPGMKESKMLVTT